jgi:hypothetical protein
MTSLGVLNFIKYSSGVAVTNCYYIYLKKLLFLSNYATKVNFFYKFFNLNFSKINDSIAGDLFFIEPLSPVNLKIKLKYILLWIYIYDNDIFPRIYGVNNYIYIGETVYFFSFI